MPCTWKLTPRKPRERRSRSRQARSHTTNHVITTCQSLWKRTATYPYLSSWIRVAGLWTVWLCPGKTSPSRWWRVPSWNPLPLTWDSNMKSARRALNEHVLRVWAAADCWVWCVHIDVKLCPEFIQLEGFGRSNFFILSGCVTVCFFQFKKFFLKWSMTPW